MEDQRIPTGRLDQGISRLYAAGSLGLFDHSQSNAVLDTSSGIEILQFRIYSSLDSKAFRKPVQSDKRGIADVLCNGIEGQWRHCRAGYGGHDHG